MYRRSTRKFCVRDRKCVRVRSKPPAIICVRPSEKPHRDVRSLFAVVVLPEIVQHLNGSRAGGGAALQSCIHAAVSWLAGWLRARYVHATESLLARAPSGRAILWGGARL
jgi:hypothetical protein